MNTETLAQQSQIIRKHVIKAQDHEYACKSSDIVPPQGQGTFPTTLATEKTIVTKDPNRVTTRRSGDGFRDDRDERDAPAVRPQRDETKQYNRTYRGVICVRRLKMVAQEPTMIGRTARLDRKLMMDAVWK